MWEAPQHHVAPMALISNYPNFWTFFSQFPPTQYEDQWRIGIVDPIAVDACMINHCFDIPRPPANRE